MLFLPQSWPLALGTVLLAGIIDVTVGEPPAAVHPVVWMGRLIGALEGGRPHDRPRAELVYGVLVVLTVTGACAAAVALTVLVAQLPWWLALPIGAAALKTTFSLRGSSALAAASSSRWRATRTRRARGSRRCSW